MIVLTGFTRADGIATLIVVALIVKAGVGLIRESGRIFLEAAPAGLDMAALGARLAAVPDVVEVHDLHVWQVTTGYPALSAHILVTPAGDCHAVEGTIQTLLRDEYRIDHTTLQVNHSDDPHARTPSDAAPVDPAHCADPHGTVYRQSRAAGFPATPAKSGNVPGSAADSDLVPPGRSHPSRSATPTAGPCWRPPGSAEPPPRRWVRNCRYRRGSAAGVTARGMSALVAGRPVSGHLLAYGDCAWGQYR